MNKLLDHSSRVYRWISKILTCTSAVLVLFSAYEAWVVYKDYTYFRQNYPEDYSFGMIASHYNPTGHLSSDALNLIRNTYGVKEVYAFSLSDYVGINFVHEYNTTYADAAAQSVSKIINELPEASTYGTVVGITDSLIPIYLSECGASKATLQDNEVILYIPDLYRDNDNIYPLEYEQAEVDKNQIIREKFIDVGHTLSVNNSKRQMELSVVGVIHSFSPDLATSFNLVRPYSIICNEQTYTRLFGECQYTYVLAFGDPTAIQYQTDVELSKIQTQLHFSNNRLFRAERLGSFTVKLVLSLIVLAASFFLTAMIRYGVQAHTDPSERQKLLVLHRLGMSKRTLSWAFTIQAVKESLLGASAALVLFVVYRCFQERDTLFSLSDYWETDVVQIATDMISRCLSQTHWLFMFIVLILIVCINCIILMFNNCNHIKMACDN